MRVLAFAAVAFLALSGCASSSTTPTTSGAASPTMEASHHDHSAKTIEVTMKGNKFVNDTVTVYQGDTVKWTHQDGMTTPHNVGADDGSFDSNPMCANPIPVGIPLSQFCMVGGSTYSHKFDSVGSVAYRCRVHSAMTGTVNVIAHPMA